ncbi:fasciclin domain-containing protein [Flavobacterium piscis]|uniref:Surface protein with fasciclin (FAS1) repeats n=1 Tax=Flavobacterium piscis TaxID=1114874 RepID=A0ABU1Y5E2_9FLAO|nr:fasciclin domain-containing protein [Flavobacterium piscis]MDR7209452.1 putative surface protein with fasciclin (FAS1) repeats [Flavobacterium piscis]
MKRYTALPKLMRLTLVVFLTLAFLNCTSEKINERTDETVNITGFLRQNDDFSMFLEMLEITNNASFMNTYGTYTLFLPNNAAVKKYLTDIGAASVKDVPSKDLEDIVKLHILDQEVATTSFTDGKIATPSQQGQFIITGAANVGGASSITVNKTAQITASNVKTGNGVIHVIDKVLRVANKTLAQTIEENESFSLFTEALKATGWYEKLNQPLTSTTVDGKTTLTGHLTVLSETNEVFKAAGINTLEDLKTKYSHLNDPLNPADSLNLFVSYRILPKLQYLADLAVSPSLETKAPLEVISVKLATGTILLNEETFNGVLEKGIPVNRPGSDVTASNGVVHAVEQNFFIKKRNPAPVYFDLADQPEFRQLSAVFRKPGNTATLAKSLFSEVTWDGVDALTYICAPKGNSNYIDRGWNGDVVEIFRFRNGNTQNIAFKTPVIIKGKYKVWVAYRQKATKNPTVKVHFDGVALPRLINFQEGGNVTLNERVLESQGYKNHVSPFTNRFNTRLCGIIDVQTTGRHTITFESLSNPGDTAWLDVVEFRPIDMDQLYPRLQSGGQGFAP